MTDTAEEADVTKRKSVFMYKKENRQTDTTEYWFHSEKDRSERFMIAGAVIEEKAKFLKEGTVVDAIFFGEDRVIGVNPETGKPWKERDDEGGPTGTS